MKVETYLFFEGRCEEAFEFYRQTLGAEVTMLMRFKDSPDPQSCPPGAGNENKVMHANLKIGETQVMASDGRCTGQASFQGFALSLAPKDVAEAERQFNALAEGGQVLMPLAETFWTPRFGMVTDRFGVMWMINVVHEGTPS